MGWEMGRSQENINQRFKTAATSTAGSYRYGEIAQLRAMAIENPTTRAKCQNAIIYNFLRLAPTSIYLTL